MRIGLLSDTHDNLENTLEAVRLFSREQVSTLLHCGDVCGPAIVEALDGFSVYIAMGNMDRVHSLGFAVEALQGSGRLDRCHQLVLGGVPIAMVHGHQEGLLNSLVYSSDYAYLFCGHTHTRMDRTVGSTRVVNPGALGGRRKEHRSVCIVDLENDRVDYYPIETEARIDNEG